MAADARLERMYCGRYFAGYDEDELVEIEEDEREAARAGVTS